MRIKILESWLLSVATMNFVTSSLALSVFCDLGKTWWDNDSGTCKDCTLCDTTKYMTVRRPCEIHRDTLCVPLKEAYIPWPWNKPINVNIEQGDEISLSNNGLESVDYPINDEYVYDYIQLGQKSEDLSQLQYGWSFPVAIATAVATCFMFFIVVLVLFAYHTREWKSIKRRIDRDVEVLSAKIRLIETSNNMEINTIGIPQNHTHIYSNINAKVTTNNNLNPGNVYTRSQD